MTEGMYSKSCEPVKQAIKDSDNCKSISKMQRERENGTTAKNRVTKLTTN